MFYEVDISTHEAIHNLINLHLFPDCHLQLGQYDHCRFHDADAVWERTGNLYSSGRNAVTYCYNIDGPGFALCLLAIWAEDQATAEIKVVSVGPFDEVALEALRDWLASSVTGRRRARNPSDYLGLH